MLRDLCQYQGYFPSTMERITRLELATSTLARWRSTRWAKSAVYIEHKACPIWCLRSESNQRHEDFQSSALPTELQRHMATEKGLEPSTSSVTGWRSNQLNYSAIAYPTQKRSGGNNRARTCDPMLVRHVLSQLSYAPVRFLCETACVIIRGESGNVKA